MWWCGLSFSVPTTGSFLCSLGLPPLKRTVPEVLFACQYRFTEAYWQCLITFFGFLESQRGRSFCWTGYLLLFSVDRLISPELLGFSVFWKMLHHICRSFVAPKIFLRCPLVWLSAKSTKQNNVQSINDILSSKLITAEFIPASTACTYINIAPDSFSTFNGVAFWRIRDFDDHTFGFKFIACRCSCWSPIDFGRVLARLILYNFVPKISSVKVFFSLYSIKLDFLCQML